MPRDDHVTTRDIVPTIMHIKDFLKFPLIYNITVIISFGYPTYNIIIFLLINIYLARDFFKKLKADLLSIKGFININIV